MAQLTTGTSSLEEAKQEAVEKCARLEADFRRLRGEHSSLQVTILRSLIASPQGRTDL